MNERNGRWCDNFESMKMWSSENRWIWSIWPVWISRHTMMTDDSILSDDFLVSVGDKCLREYHVTLSDTCILLKPTDFMSGKFVEISGRRIVSCRETTSADKDEEDVEKESPSQKSLFSLHYLPSESSLTLKKFTFLRSVTGLRVRQTTIPDRTFQEFKKSQVPSILRCSETPIFEVWGSGIVNCFVVSEIIGLHLVGVELLCFIFEIHSLWGFVPSYPGI